MKKVFFYTFVCLFSAGFVTSCGSCDEEKCEKENQPATQPTEQEAQQVLSQDNAELIDVENAQVVTEPNGDQQVLTEVTATPEVVE